MLFSSSINQVFFYALKWKRLIWNFTILLQDIKLHSACIKEPHMAACLNDYREHHKFAHSSLLHIHFHHAFVANLSPINLSIYWYTLKIHSVHLTKDYQENKTLKCNAIVYVK